MENAIQTQPLSFWRQYLNCVYAKIFSILTRVIYRIVFCFKLNQRISQNFMELAFGAKNDLSLKFGFRMLCKPYPTENIMLAGVNATSLI